MGVDTAPVTTASDAAKAPVVVRALGEKRAAIRYVLTLGAILLVLYALVYHSWGPESFASEWLTSYLGLVANVSASVLRLLGEQVSLHGTSVSGRFSYVVVVDCAALDVQAMFTAAVLAFPARWVARLIGLASGLAAIFVINTARLVTLYYAGSYSSSLFKTLHEEVFVLVIVALVCGMFLLWATWATSRVRATVEAVPEAT